MINHPSRALRTSKPNNSTTKVCSICGNDYEGWGHNAWPINDGRCCDDCNNIVIAHRLLRSIQLSK